ncbi:sugar transferase [Pedobacter sp. ASV1-7]|uniref:sugar transferase n=1 Tax=Pedobacter sp. ASV1-7 TaxID=3145237 RepID=UPI0032E88974
MQNIDKLWITILFLLGLVTFIVAFMFLSYYINKKVVPEIDRDMDNAVINLDGPHAITETKWTRYLEIFIACFMLFFLLPLFILVAVIIKLESKGPIFNLNLYIGLDGKPFHCIKFRTFKLAQVKPTGNSIEKQKINYTKFGTFLVKTSIDEIPILFNVLMGSVSLVGRSLYLSDPKNLVKVPAQYKEIILSVKPGLASLHTIGVRRKKIKPDHMYILDAFYAERKSLVFDIKVLLSSVVILGLNTEY